MKHYDYIMTGAGGAGLSLVFHMLQTSLKDRKILLIDKTEKTKNDRTWCFWEKTPGPFEAIVHQRWDRMHFHGEEYSELLDLSPYAYKMIRGIDFYEHVQQQIQQFPNVEQLRADVRAIHNTPFGARVETSDGTFTADWVFNSMRDPREQSSLNGHVYFLQHFKGWVIQTDKPFFNPAQATLMDFRIPQHGECRFLYVLPTDERRALVEFTLFSPHLLLSEEYDTALRSYLQEYLGLHDYTVAHEEFGVIPMTDQPFPSQAGEHIINIGTAGGMTKASTGYTFRRIQQDSEQLVGALLRCGCPERKPSSGQWRFTWYDRILLQVMNQHYYPAKGIFTDIFRHNPANRVLKFLDEETHPREELLVTHSVPKLPFLRGLFHAIFR